MRHSYPLSSASRQRTVRCVIHVTRPLVTWFLFIGGNVALAGCGTMAHTATHHSPPVSATPQSTATPAVLYEANFSQGLANWNPSPGWAVMDGALQSDSGGQRAVTIPYQPATHDYSVEFSLRVVSVPVNGGFYNLSAAPTPTVDGYVASVNMLLAPGPHPGGAHPAASVLIAPLDHQDLSAEQVIDFEPTSNARLYRVAVHGPTVVFSVDGHVVSRASSTSTSQLSSSPLRLDCDSVVISVRALRILAA